MSLGIAVIKIGLHNSCIYYAWCVFVQHSSNVADIYIADVATHQRDNEFIA